LAGAPRRLGSHDLRMLRFLRDRSRHWEHVPLFNFSPAKCLGLDRIAIFTWMHRGVLHNRPPRGFFVFWFKISLESLPGVD